VIRPIRVDHTDFFKWLLKLIHSWKEHHPHKIVLHEECYVCQFDESFSSLSRLGWVIFKSLKTWMRSNFVW
jgi:hypothetical protein